MDTKKITIMKKLVLSLAIIAFVSITTFSQVFDLLGEINPEYNIQDIESKGDLLFAALGEGGVMVSSDEGFTWSATSPLPDAGFGQESAYSIFAASNGDLIVGGNQTYNGAPLSGSVFRSSNNGTTWSFQTFDGLTGYEQSGKIVELSDGSLMMRGGQSKLFISSLSSTEWTQTISPGGVIFGFENINDEIFVVTNPSTGTAGTWVTSDLGTTWSRYGGNGTPVSGGTVTMAPVISTENYKFVCIGGTYGQKGVFRSGINDTLWVEMNNGIGSSGIYPICMATDNETIWMVFQDTGGGCNFTSTSDFAANWETPVAGLPQQGVGGPCVPKIMVFKSHLYTYANTSIYRIEDVANPSATGKQKYINDNIEVYPNPVTSQLSIRFKKSSINCQWEVLNVFGQEIMNGQTNATSGNNITVNVESLPEGYFILKTTMDGETSVNKFLKK